jgi:Flp pilus assembly protein TadD
MGALAALSYQAAKSPGRGREVVDLTQLAAKTPGAPTAMLSSLAARESLGHAILGDQAASASALARANRLLEQTTLEEDFDWLYVWGPAELACYQMTAAHHLGQGTAAVNAARQAVALGDAERLPRTQAFYLTFLGKSLARIGHYEEATTVLHKALTSPVRKGSQRLTQELRESGQLLASAPHAPTRDFAAMIDHLLLPPR